MAASERKDKKASWMKETSDSVSEVIMNGVFSSGKYSTRRYRLDFYRGRLAKAKIEAFYYEEMIRLEERLDLEGRSTTAGGSYEELLAEVQELRLRERSSESGPVKKVKKEKKEKKEFNSLDEDSDGESVVFAESVVFSGGD